MELALVFMKVVVYW